MNSIHKKLSVLAARVASVADVVKRIKQRVPSTIKQQDLIDKVTEYSKTGDPRDDIDLRESAMLFPSDELGDEFNVGRREVDVSWTSHANYRDLLRDVNSGIVNKEIVKVIENGPNRRDTQKLKLQKPNFGTAVVDFDFRRPTDIEADVITVWK